MQRKILETYFSGVEDSLDDEHMSSADNIYSAEEHRSVDNVPEMDFLFYLILSKLDITGDIRTSIQEIADKIESGCELLRCVSKIRIDYICLTEPEQDDFFSYAGEFWLSGSGSYSASKTGLRIMIKCSSGKRKLEAVFNLMTMMTKVSDSYTSEPSNVYVCDKREDGTWNKKKELQLYLQDFKKIIKSENKTLPEKNETFKSFSMIAKIMNFSSMDCVYRDYKYLMKNCRIDSWIDDFIIREFTKEWRKQSRSDVLKLTDALFREMCRDNVPLLKINDWPREQCFVFAHPAESTQIAVHIMSTMENFVNERIRTEGIRILSMRVMKTKDYLDLFIIITLEALIDERSDGTPYVMHPIILWKLQNYYPEIENVVHAVFPQITDEAFDKFYNII